MPYKQTDLEAAEAELRRLAEKNNWQPERLQRSLATLRYFFKGGGNAKGFAYGAVRHIVEDFFVKFCEKRGIKNLPGQQEAWYDYTRLNASF